jgi:hypothetical protein
VKEEDKPPDNLTGKVLKICTFKVSEESLGYRYGELLLKTLFEYTFENEYDWAFVTAFERHTELFRLLEDFGFRRLSKKTESGELVYAKPFSRVAENDDAQGALDYHVRYGPRRFQFNAEAVYLVPIQTRYADRLFPETAIQSQLFRDQSPCGSAIRKAYLCHSAVKTLEPGAILVFYRSQEKQGLIAVGVVEEAFHSKSVEKIARKVAKRTVYSLRDIEDMCGQDVLVILFRQARVFCPAVLDNEAVEGRIMMRAPQSIMKIREEGAEWIQRLICQ